MILHPFDCVIGPVLGEKGILPVQSRWVTGIVKRDTTQFTVAVVNPYYRSFRIGMDTAIQKPPAIASQFEHIHRSDADPSRFTVLPRRNRSSNSLFDQIILISRTAIVNIRPGMGMGNADNDPRDRNTRPVADLFAHPLAVITLESDESQCHHDRRVSIRRLNRQSAGIEIIVCAGRDLALGKSAHLHVI